jgi:CarD family transcriptional regulator
MDTGISIEGSPVSVGERVVYPNGGICRVQGVQSTSIAGREWRMLILQREEDLAKVMVPQEKVATIGLRKVASARSIELLFEFLASSSDDPELDWKVRHRENFEKMAAGGLLDTAQVLKGLHALAQLRPLPSKEREMYDSARHQLVGEISAALSLPPAVAENQIALALIPPPGSGRSAPTAVPFDLKSLRRSVGGRRSASGGDEFDGLDGEDDFAAGGEEEGDEAIADGDESPSAAPTARNEDEEGDAEEPPARAPAKKAATPKPATPKASKQSESEVTSKPPKRASAAKPSTQAPAAPKKVAEKAVGKPAAEKKSAAKKKPVAPKGEAAPSGKSKSAKGTKASKVSTPSQAKSAPKSNAKAPAKAAEKSAKKRSRK